MIMVLCECKRCAAAQEIPPADFVLFPHEVVVACCVGGWCDVVFVRGEPVEDYSRERRVALHLLQSGVKTCLSCCSGFAGGFMGAGEHVVYSFVMVVADGALGGDGGMSFECVDGKPSMDEFQGVGLVWNVIECSPVDYPVDIISSLGGPLVSIFEVFADNL